MTLYLSFSLFLCDNRSNISRALWAGNSAGCTSGREPACANPFVREAAYKAIRSTTAGLAGIYLYTGPQMPQPARPSIEELARDKS